jgi:hypothetical protein
VIIVVVNSISSGDCLRDCLTKCAEEIILPERRRVLGKPKRLCYDDEVSEAQANGVFNAIEN